ncbi:MAG: transglycosylase SLT domain-containing protein [Candidatus Binatia bacterium]
MRASRNFNFLLLAIVGIFGCASRDQQYYSTAATSAPAQVVGALPFAAHSTPTLQPTTPQVPQQIESPKVVETVSVPPMPAPQPAPPAPVAEVKNDRTEGRAKSTPTHAPTNHSATLNPVKNDQGLLEFLDKDIDKAVEQPKERRRLQFSKEVVDHPRVRQFIRQYSATNKDYFQTLLARSGKYMPIIAKVLADEGLPEELAYLALLESEFLVNTTSQSGAVGLWQFVPSTARQYGLRIDDWVDERRDPVKSTRAAAAYLKDLHRYYGRWYLVTAAYNAGPAIIDKALQTSRAADFWGIKEKAQLRQETRNFVPKFVAIALIATNPKKYGFNNLRYEEPLEFDEVDAEGLLKIDAAAEMAEADLTAMKELNPALLRNVTPPGARGYRLRVPAGKALVFAKAGEYQRNKEQESVRVVTHEVTRGETLVSIAARYGQAVSSLMELNGLTTARLQIGQKLRVIFEGIRGTLR